VRTTLASTVFVVPAFLDPATCRRLRRAMDSGLSEPAEVLHDTIDQQDDVRRVSNIEVDVASLEELEQRLDAHRDAIGAFYGRALNEREGASFLRYTDGGFYRRHRDRAIVDSWPGAARRDVAVVVFLNSSRHAGPGDFDGGVLRLFVDDRPVAIHPAEGLLVAFRADVLHEVTVVRSGTRDAIVDWFYGQC
jgi:predicted 2-oxoglutarate/Fe(II)-dependent dioxygenase YbiX